jgi:hypothetical protein
MQLDRTYRGFPALEIHCLGSTITEALPQSTAMEVLPFEDDKMFHSASTKMQSYTDLSATAGSIPHCYYDTSSVTDRNTWRPLTRCKSNGAIEL